MEIVFLDSYTLGQNDVDYSPLHQFGTFSAYDFTTRAEIENRVRNADILIVNKHQIDEDLLKCAKNLKLIQVAATGYNNINKDAVLSRAIPVCNVIGYSTNSVVQQVFASLLAVLNRPEYYHREVTNGRWQHCRDFCFYDHSIEELANKKLGIIGFGTIGKRMAATGHVFGMQIQASGRNGLVSAPAYVQESSIEKILMECDIVSLHVPLTDQTRTMINASSLSKMKQNAILINTGRGGLIDETALYQYLITNPSFTAILDVLTSEPPQNGHPLIGLPNCRISPHIAWASRQSRQRLIDGMAENIKNFMDNNITNRVY